jgi:hypothetical protein
MPNILRNGDAETAGCRFTGWLRANNVGEKKFHFREPSSPSVRARFTLTPRQTGIRSILARWGDQMITAPFVGLSLVVSVATGPITDPTAPGEHLSTQQKNAAVQSYVRTATECVAHAVVANPHYAVTNIAAVDPTGEKTAGVTTAADKPAGDKITSGKIASDQTGNEQTAKDQTANDLGELIVDAMPVCANSMRAMIDAYDRYFGDGSGEAFFSGPYLDVLPAAISKRVKQLSEK